MKSFILLLALSTPLFARLGETMEQCVERYGEIVKERSGAIPSVYFHKDDFEIEIIFYEGKVESINYEKKGKKEDKGSKSQPISAAERDAILKANGPDKIWSVEHKEESVFYRTSDSSLRASYYTYDHHLSITTIIGLNRQSKILDEIEKKKAQKKTEGL